jgi:phospholipase D1/2
MPNSKKPENKSAGRRPVWIGVAILLALFALAAAWKWTPLADFLDFRRMSGWIASVRQSPARHVYVIAAYLIGSILLVPITVLILMTAVIFGPVLGSAYSLVGCLAGAAITYAIGLLLGQSLVQRIAGKKWQRLEKKIAQSGIVAVAALRLLPVAPFTVVNVVSGAFKVPLRDYTLGSLLGLAPGILVTNLFAHQLENAIRHPGPGTIVILAALVVITALGAVWFKRKFATT